MSIEHTNCQHEQMARRSFLGRASLGLGSMAFAGLLQPSVLAASTGRGVGQNFQGVVNPRHVVPKAKRVTLWLLGGVSELDTDPPTPKADLLVAGAGPLTSLVLGG